MTEFKKKIYISSITITITTFLLLTIICIIKIIFEINDNTISINSPIEVIIEFLLYLLLAIFVGIQIGLYSIPITLLFIKLQKFMHRKFIMTVYFVIIVILFIASIIFWLLLPIGFTLLVSSIVNFNIFKKYDKFEVLVSRFRIYNYFLK